MKKLLFMPFLEDLHNSWFAERQMFGAGGTPQEIFEVLNRGEGLVEQKISESVKHSLPQQFELSGEKIGSLIYDTKNQEIKIEPNQTK